MRRVVAGHTAHAASGMRARTAHIESGNGAAIVGVTQNGSRREQLVQTQSAVRDIAAHETENALHIERAHGCARYHRSLESGRETLDRIEHQIGDFVAMRVPGFSAGQFGRDVLAEQTRDMFAGGSQRIVDERRDQHLHDGRLRPAERTRVRISALHVTKAWRHDDAGREMIARFGQTGKTRQFGKRHIHAERARSAAIARDTLAEIFGQRGRIDQRLKQELRVQIGDYRAAAEDLAGIRHGAHGAPFLDQYLAHAGMGAQIDAELAAGRGHRLCDRTHAADRVSPRPFLAVHFADGVMQQHIGGAGSVRARIISHDRVEPERGLDRIAFEPAVEPVACRLAEQRQQVAFGCHVGVAHETRQRDGADHFAESRDPAALRDIRRRFEKRFADEIGELRQAIRKRVEPVRVARGKLRDFGFGDALARPKIVAIVQRQEILDATRQDAEAVFGKPHVGNHLRRQQRNRVTGHGIPKARREFLRDRGAADDTAPLQHGDGETGARQIERANEPVMPPADNDHIRFAHGEKVLFLDGRCRRRDVQAARATNESFLHAGRLPGPIAR